MDLPKPPQEQELKNIIDKLAQFVARNGLEFEQMTKTKQKDNPKFSFLFGGDYFSYYQYKVTTEQAILKHRQAREQSAPQQPSQQLPQQPPQMILPHSQPPYSGPNNQNYQNSYSSYNYGPSSNYAADPNQFPPSVVSSNYPPPPQFNIPPIPGESPSMHMGSGPPGMGGNNFPLHSLHPSSYGDSPYMQGGNTSERNFPSAHSNFPPQGNMETNYGSTQNAPMIPPGTEHGNSNSSGYTHAPPRLIGVNTPSGLPLGGNLPINSLSGQAPPDTSTNQPASTGPPPDTSLEQILQEEQELQEQISQSEQNLNAQQLVLDQQREVQIREGIYVARGERLNKEAEDYGLIVQEFEDLLIPITESCTKDSISNGKHWIFTRAVSAVVNQWISAYLLYKSTAVSGPFSHKLHIIYLMNDVLHHCLRKNADSLKDFLEKSLSPMYCTAYTCASDDQRSKLEKLLSLWESKMHLEQSLLNELRNPEQTVVNFNNDLMNEFSQVVATVDQQLNTTFDGYKQQHNAFVQHANSQLQQLQQQKRQMEQSQLQQQAPPPPPPHHGFMTMQGQQQFPAGGSQPPIPAGMDFNQPPPGFSSGDFPLVDFSKPPPGFMCEEKENVVPTVPYFELPAALMAPLINITDSKFKQLDPSKLRLPLPTPPSERLLAAVENFYLPPSHERPRNCDGWEQIALFDYYKAKTNAMRESERQVKDGLREISRSPSPTVIEIVTDQDLYEHQGPVRRYRSVSPEEFEEEEKQVEERVASPPSVRFPQRSESPSPVPISNRSPVQREVKSPSRSPSYSPNQRQRSSSRSPVDPGFSRARSRSITPPSFGGAPTLPYSIEETNKGHQMLLSMGWSGAGLGVKEQGIATPISAAEVRETPAERFRGLGIPSAQSDPFEAFRKNKGQAFINRMKQRAEEREKRETL